MPTSADDAVARVTQALKEGFETITQIDIREAFRQKLGVDFCNYRILGACNPQAAYEVLQLEPGSPLGTVLISTWPASSPLGQCPHPTPLGPCTPVCLL